eukprot:scaffold23760_cov49-Phaeocystis_antarctica.AAC.2
MARVPTGEIGGGGGLRRSGSDSGGGAEGEAGSEGGGGSKEGATARCAASRPPVRCPSAPSTAASEMSTPGPLFICT